SALIAFKDILGVLTNNSALGKDLAPHSTDLNRSQNHKRIVAQEDVNTFLTLKFGIYNINRIKNTKATRNVRLWQDAKIKYYWASENEY
ncbi:8814_t:CDS:1, partial [Gigaspora margarita]